MKKNMIKMQEKGFTLLEALVSIAIILILSAILLPSYGSFQAQFALLRSAYKLSNDIRKAQEMSVSAKELSLAEGVPPGYGVYLEAGPGKKSYILYADINPAQGNDHYDGPQDRIVETINLERGVYIESILPLTEISINFSGPDPITTISNNSPSAIITLSLEVDSTKSRKVFVNSVGLIYVE